MAIIQSAGLRWPAAARAPSVLTNGMTLFTITGSPIGIWLLQLQCATVNDTTASTVQFSSTPTLGSAKTFSGATTSIAAAVTGVGATVTLNKTALTTAPDIITGANGGVALGANVSNMIIVEPGIITLVVGIGSTTGTWGTYLAYIPMGQGCMVV